MSRIRRQRREAAARKASLPGFEVGGPVRGQEETSSPLHDERLDAVVRRLADSGARTVLDLGCGSGSLLRRLADDQRFTRLVGVDASATALLVAERTLAPIYPVDGERLSLEHGSFVEMGERLGGFDAAALVETIEHIPPADLSRVERSVFEQMRPRVVVVTTPNREYNPVYGIPEGRLRHEDHEFEWDRARFRRWAEGVGERCGYRIDVELVGPLDALRGTPTQMATFRRA